MDSEPAGYLPPPFVRRMRGLLGAEAEAFLAALSEPPVRGLRVNTLKLSPEHFRKLSPWPLESVPWCDAGLIFPPEARPGKHPYHAAGLYYLQEPSALAVAEALAPQPGDLVLDLAAAPGGKSTHLTSLMGNWGTLVANEVSRGRVGALAENLERWGSTQAVIINEEPWKLAKCWGAVFDKVLLDAPCSGEGMFRKSAEALAAWSEANVRGCARRQRRLLDEAAALVKPGGALAYSTCTFAPEEDEEVVASFLTSHPDFAMATLELPGTIPAHPDWLPPDLHNPELAKAACLWPHLAPGEGHFIALLKRIGGTPGRVHGADFKPVPPHAQRLWRDFVAATLSPDPAAKKRLAIFGSKLYAVPDVVPPLDGLKVLRTGLCLGTLHEKRFEPSHALALALTAEAAQRTLELAPDDPRLRLYLQGHPLEHPGEDGWLLITVSGFPLGWGRRAGGIVKNAYPKGLRWHP